LSFPTTIDLVQLQPAPQTTTILYSKSSQLILYSQYAEKDCIENSDLAIHERAWDKCELLQQQSEWGLCLDVIYSVGSDQIGSAQAEGLKLHTADWRSQLIVSDSPMFLRFFSKTHQINIKAENRQIVHEEQRHNKPGDREREHLSRQILE
jgi:hypothetical protein